MSKPRKRIYELKKQNIDAKNLLQLYIQERTSSRRNVQKSTTHEWPREAAESINIGDAFAGVLRALLALLTPEIGCCRQGTVRTANGGVQGEHAPA